MELVSQLVTVVVKRKRKEGRKEERKKERKKKERKINCCINLCISGNTFGLIRCRKEPIFLEWNWEVGELPEYYSNKHTP